MDVAFVIITTRYVEQIRDMELEQIVVLTGSPVSYPTHRACHEPHSR